MVDAPVEESFYSQRERQSVPFVQGDSDLIMSFAQPEAGSFDSEFGHINRDFRMAKTDAGDANFLNQAGPLCRAVDEMLGVNSRFSMMLKHDMFLLNNMSVARGGFAMETLVTRKKKETARYVQDSQGFFKRGEEEQR